MADDNEHARYEQAQRRELDGHVAQIARDLRRLADTVEHLAGRFDGNHDGTAPVATYSTVVGEIQAEVLSALANLPLTRLTREAGEADMASVLARPKEQARG